MERQFLIKNMVYDLDKEQITGLSGTYNKEIAIKPTESFVFKDFLKDEGIDTLE